MPGKYKDFTKDVLLGLAIGGAFFIAATSPFFLVNIARRIIRNRKYIKNKFDERKFVRALERLRKNRLIILSEINGKFKVELTEKGKRKVKEIQFENMRIEEPKLWDGKWRLVIFDIPDKQRRKARDALREKLQKLAFYPLQKSVWAHPFPCDKEIQFLCELFDIVPFVNIVTANKIENDVKLKKHFKLL